MATKFEQAILLPVHLELAIRVKPVQIDRGELAMFHDVVAEYLPEESAYLRTFPLRRKTDNKFYNLVQWAVKQLKLDKCATGVNRKFFAASPGGMQRLHELILVFFYDIGKQLDPLIDQLDVARNELLVTLLRLLPPESLHKVVNSQSTRRRVFAEGFRCLHSDKLAEFLQLARLPVRDALGPFLRRKYRLY